MLHVSAHDRIPGEKNNYHHNMQCIPPHWIAPARQTIHLVSFLNELELVICNGRRCVSEPEWTRVIDQKSVIDYIIPDAQLLRESGVVHIDSTDIGMSDHLVEQQRILGDGVMLFIVKHYRQRLRPFQREIVRWRRGNEGK